MRATLFCRNRRPSPIMAFLLPVMLLAAGAAAAKAPQTNTVTRRWNHRDLYDQGARRASPPPPRNSCSTPASWLRTTHPPAASAT